jgi:hypothetical protein
MAVDSTFHRNQPYRSPHHSRWGDALPKATFMQSWETPEHEQGWYTRKELADMDIAYVGRYFTYPTVDWDGGITTPKPHPTVTRSAKNKTDRSDRQYWVKAAISNHALQHTYGEKVLTMIGTPTDGLPVNQPLLQQALAEAILRKMVNQPFKRF